MRVKTHLGTFNTIEDAAKCHGRTKAEVNKYCLSTHPLWTTWNFIGPSQVEPQLKPEVIVYIEKPSPVVEKLNISWIGGLLEELPISKPEENKNCLLCKSYLPISEFTYRKSVRAICKDCNHKQCSKCSKIKEKGLFPILKTAPDGYRNQCKSCRKVSYNKYENSEKGKITRNRSIIKRKELLMDIMSTT